MTNGDKIRNMSDEELVEFIMGVREEFINESFYYKIISGKRFEYTDDILDWLNSEEKIGRNYTIYACDFDGTLAESIYPRHRKSEHDTDKPFNQTPETGEQSYSVDLQMWRTVARGG